MNVLRFSNIFIGFSVALMLVCAGLLFVFGLNVGIEFTGGSLLEVEYQAERPQNAEVRELLGTAGIEVSSVQPVGERGMIIRMQDISEDQHQQALVALGSQARELRFESIGPIIGRELRSKAFVLMAISLLAIIVYVTFAFRKITKPVQSWQWSVVALGTLLHDILVPLGALAIAGQFLGEQITIPVVVALLTVVGYSVNDTVVIYDRIRENLGKKVGYDFADTVNQSLRQTFTRSLNTSFTTLLVVLAILFFGGETLSGFAFTLAVGIVAGSWSSLFLAPPLLLKWAKRGASP